MLKALRALLRQWHLEHPATHMPQTLVLERF